MSEHKDENSTETGQTEELPVVHPVDHDAKPASTFSRLLGFVLLVAVIIGAGLAANGQLMPLVESVSATLQEQGGEEEATVEALPVAEPAISQPEPIAEKQKQPQPVVDEQPAVAASQEAEALISTIEQLRSELRQMESSQKSLQSSLHEQQRMNLQVRLRWITDPASRAPQIQLAWEEISLLPGLSSDERNRAGEMLALARTTVEKLNSWQAALHKWAEAMATPTHQDIMPKPEHPWLAWIVGQFHLRQAPTEEARRLDSLRERLLDVSRALTLEQWPADGAWQGLHAELLMQARTLQPDADAAAIDLGLPESFSAIEADMKTLRDTARQWANGAGGEF